MCGCTFLASCYKDCCDPATEKCCLFPPTPGATGGSSVCEKACCSKDSDCGTATKPCVPKCPTIKRCGGKYGEEPVKCCGPDEWCATNSKEEGIRNFAICCPKGRMGCGAVGTGQTFCCPSGEKCCTGQKGEKGSCCPRGHDCCGKACCPPGRNCCRGKCCPPGERCASCGDQDRCCNPLTHKCDCTCKRGHTVKCGKDCCHPRRHKCCPARKGRPKRCVPKGASCTP